MAGSEKCKDIADKVESEGLLAHNQNVARMLSIGSKKELQEIVYSMSTDVCNTKLL